MQFEWFIAWRYLRSGYRSSFLSPITIIAVGSVTVGVGALLVSFSIHNGFEADLRDKILGTNAHLLVVAPGVLGQTLQMAQAIGRLDNVAGCAPVIWVEGLATFEDEKTGGMTEKPVLVKGVLASEERRATKLEEYLVTGQLEALGFDPPKPDTPWDMPKAALLGYGVADALFRIPEYRQMNPSMARDEPYKLIQGREIRVLSPKQVEGPTGRNFLSHKLDVYGVLRSGYWQTDGMVVVVPLPLAAYLKGTFSPELDTIPVEALEIALRDLDQLEQTRRAVYHLLEKQFNKSLRINDWGNAEAALLEAIKIEKVVMFVVIGMVVMVAAFNIMSTLIMTVMRKTREIGILVTMGGRRRSILILFVLTGGLIGLVGTILGVAFGTAISLALQKYGLSLPGDVYTLDHVPVKIKIMDYIIVISSTLVACLVAGIYPAWQAACLDPVEALRHE